MITRFCRRAAFILLCTLLAAIKADAAPRHGIAMHGEPQLAAGFTHLPYANPDAPKGGQLRLAVTGSYDNLNPFIIKGQRVGAVRQYVFESLMARNRAEPFALYGLLAESIDVPADRTSVTFRLRPQARFSDGTPVTAEDVAYSLETLRAHGRPNHRTYYGKVSSVEITDRHTITMALDGADRELVLIIGLMPILPKSFFENRQFEQTTLEPLIGSGPYTIGEVQPGKKITFNRNPDYWGGDLPINRGLWNFDAISIDFYRDNQSAFEALKKNLVDIREESDPVRWATGYDFPAVSSGEFIKEVVPTQQPAAATGLVFNTRRPLLADAKVRQALIHAFDFEWANKNLFHSLFRRTQGYFDRSMLSAIGNPASTAEIASLQAIGAQLPDNLLAGTFRMPISDGSGRDRKLLRQSIKLLHEAGWKFADNQLVNIESGAPFRFTLHTTTREQERIGLHFQRSLRQIGITLDIRQIDSAQYQRRLQTFDFDMLQFTWFNSLSPGNEQAFYWGSAARDQEGSRNYMGAASPQIDQTIDRLLTVTAHEDFIDTARSLDRLLISGFYMVPLYHPPGQWLGRWSHIRHPKTPSLYGFHPSTAWYEK